MSVHCSQAENTIEETHKRFIHRVFLAWALRYIVEREVELRLPTLHRQKMVQELHDRHRSNEVTGYVGDEIVV